MQFEYTPFVLPLIAAAAIASGIAIYAWKHRSTPGAAALAALALAITQWLLGYCLEIAGADLPTKLFWGKSQYLAITLTPVLWLIFAFYQSRQRQALTHHNHIFLAIMPAITFLLVLTTESHGLIWKDVYLSQAAGFSALGVSYGIWFWVHSAYSYLLLLAGTVLILRGVRRGQQLYRRQAAALIVGVLAPWVGNFIYLTGMSPVPGLDLTPFAFTFTIVAIAWSIFGFRLIELRPVARELVVDEMQDGMIVLDANNRIADINPAAARMFDLQASQVVGAQATQALGRWSQFIDKYRTTVEAVDELTVGEGEDCRWYELNLTPLHDRRERFVGRVITVRDITRRRQAEEQLRQLSRAVEASPVSIVITDTDGHIQYVNPKFVQVTGYTRDEALGQNPRLLKTDETPPEVHRDLWETIGRGQEWRGEFCNRKKNGEHYWESASISPIPDASGKLAHYVAVKEDITEQRILQKQLLQQQEALAIARDQALEASQFKTQLLAKVNHELRTPLGAILGYAELLHSGSFGTLSDQQKPATSQIIESSHYLNALINELLDAAQIESRQLKLHLGPCFPAATLQKVAASMSVLAGKKGLALNTFVAADMPEQIIADEQRLQQILINLVGNAIKYTKTGEVCVHISPAGNQQWAIRISDTGPGIPPEAVTHIFEPFRQAYTALTPENRGAGLGLTITHQLVCLMGGEINVESKMGAGSTFTVSLPLETSPLTDDASNLEQLSDLE